MNSCKYLWSKTKLAYNRQHLVFQKYFHFFLQTRINISIIHSHRYRMNGIIQLQDQEEQEEGEGRKLWRWGCQSRPVQSQARTSKLMLDVDCGMWKQGKVCQRANNTAFKEGILQIYCSGTWLGASAVRWQTWTTWPRSSVCRATKCWATSSGGCAPASASTPASTSRTRPACLGTTFRRRSKKPVSLVQTTVL